jgi:nitrogenase molybdenum-iron protein NifN
VPERYRKEKWRLVDTYVDGNKYVSKKRALIYGEEDFVVSMAGFLAEVGMIPVLCASGGKSKTFKAALEQMLPANLIDRMIIQNDMDFTCMEETAAAMPEEFRPEIIIGNSKGYAMARRLKVPLVRVGFPIHDRIGGSRILHVGYKGALNLFDNIVNTILTAKQTESRIGYAYM